MTHLSDELIDQAAEKLEIPPNARDHLARCQECAAQVARIRELRDRFATLPRAIEPHESTWPRLHSTILARRARRRTFASGAALALAAALLFAVVRVSESPVSDTASSASSELMELRGMVPPSIVDAMEANLTVYDAALRELEEHAASEESNIELRQRIDDLRRKRSALLRQSPIS